MNTRRIERVLSNAPGFVGVFASDKIPQITVSKTPVCLVANLDPSWKKGSHWVAFCVHTDEKGKKTVEIFDSYGTRPKVKLVRKKDWRLKHNPIRFQKTDSTVCGQYCVYFVKKRSRGIAFSSIVRSLKAKKDADEYVEKFVAKLEENKSLPTGRKLLHRLEGDQCCCASGGGNTRPAWRIQDHPLLLPSKT